MSLLTSNELPAVGGGVTGGKSSSLLMLSCANSLVIPKVSEILLNSPSQLSDLMKLPLTVMIPWRPGIFIIRYAY